MIEICLFTWSRSHGAKLDKANAATCFSSWSHVTNGQRDQTIVVPQQHRVAEFVIGGRLNFARQIKTFVNRIRDFAARIQDSVSNACREVTDAVYEGLD